MVESESAHDPNEKGAQRRISVPLLSKLFDAFHSRKFRIHPQSLFTLTFLSSSLIMHCGNCKRDSFQPRVAISSAQDLLRLHHGHGTFDLDSSKIQQILTDGEKDLADYATEISFLRSKILFIETKMENLRNHLEGYRSLVAPIRKVPDDILRLVFAYLCNKRMTLQKAIIPPALSLSAVCSHWRYIMLSTPSLWAKISLYFSHEYSPLSCVVQFYLERSKEALLDVCVTTDWKELLTEKRDHPAFRPLLDHSHRWRDVIFHGKQALSLFHETASFYPALESLGLFSDDLHHPTDFGVMPKLHSLTLYGLSSPLISGSFPWHQLKTLTIYDYESNIPSFMKVCTNLQILEMRLELDLEPEAELPVSVVHSAIQTLILSLEGSKEPRMEVLERLLKPLSFPGLTSLHVEVAPKSPEPWPATAMSAFLARSRFNLTVLSITGIVFISENDLISFLRHLPLVVDLKVHDPSTTHYNAVFPVTPTFISTLHAFQPNHAHCSTARLLPNLKRLSLHVRSEFNELTFVEMVVSRWIPDATYAKEIGVVCLRRVEVCIGGDEYTGTMHEMKVDAKKLSPLKILQQQGLIVNVIDGKKYVEID